ncbi:MAG: DUF1697 domain-containing protein [Acidobacteriota bacterium]
MRYVALLRGINVGGNTMVKMDELRTMFESLGFKNVKSYINSGNLAFDSKKANEANLSAKIEVAVEKHVAKPVLVMVRVQQDIERILANNPFEGKYKTHKEMHVLFLKKEMANDDRHRLMEAGGDNERYEVDGREIYCHLPMGVADSLVGKGFIEKKLKTVATGRNWRTVEKLAVL